ncbi:hypothetical protein [Streptomyces xantholiticus]|uniref:hypothetical protein n=1 Tax=Streptomyces xantholiticus TaxID=68285 RepID=UPI00167A2D65|nr:hypothetical protein [Streptomyces xantholiticus]GGW22797.1 hypothetical protein GCM10010381_01190 [Streptomyces xantholiticus]
MNTQPQRFGILVLPEAVEAHDTATLTRNAIRSAVVDATGEQGASGYPRYVGDGVEADIDPETRAVEALLVDGAELSLGLVARVVDASEV